MNSTFDRRPAAPACISHNQRIRRAAAIVVAAALVGAHVAGDALTQSASAARPEILSEAVLDRLPSEWRAPAAKHVRATPAEQRRFLALSEEVLRQTLARLLARVPAADSFLKTQLSKDMSPLVRTTITQTIAADTRWMSLPETPAMIERVVTTDPDPKVSLAALESLRRWRMRRLTSLLNERVAEAVDRNDSASLGRLLAEQERWLSLERGTMLPAFVRDPVPVFTVCHRIAACASWLSEISGPAR